MKYSIFMFVLSIGFLFLQGTQISERVYTNLANIELLKWNSESKFDKAKQYLEHANHFRERGGSIWQQRGYIEYIDALYTRVMDEKLSNYQQSKLVYRYALNLENQGYKQQALETYLRAVEFDERCIICIYNAYRISLYREDAILADRLVEDLVSLTPEYPVNRTLGSGLTLSGYDLDEFALERESEISVNLYWHYPTTLRNEICPEDEVCFIETREWQFILGREFLYQVGKVNNLLENGGFENNLSSIALMPQGYKSMVGYGRFQNAPFTFLSAHYSLILDNSYDEVSQVMRVDNDESQLNGIISVRPVNVIPGEIYLFGGGMRVAQQSEGVLGGVWRTLLDENIYYSYVVSPGGEESWQYYSDLFEAPKSAAFFLPLAFTRNSGQVYFDNLLFIQISMPSLNTFLNN